MGGTQIPSGAKASKTVSSAELPRELRAYRDWLIKADHEALQSYDKAVITLSGGALAISITFIHDIAPAPKGATICLLGVAWGCFASSIVAILVSKLTIHWALRSAIGQVDAGTIYQQEPGARFAVWTKFLNVFAGLAFLLGVAFLASFSITNLLSASRASPMSWIEY